MPPIKRVSQQNIGTYLLWVAFLLLGVSYVVTTIVSFNKIDSITESMLLKRVEDVEEKNTLLMNVLNSLNMTISGIDVNVSLVPFLMDVEELKMKNATVRQVNTGVGLTGGPITQDGTISMETLNPDPAGIFGDGTKVSQVTIDSQGRVTAVQDVAITFPPTGIVVQEEGVSLPTAANTLNFVGGSVTAIGTGTSKTIAISQSTSGTYYAYVYATGGVATTTASTLQWPVVGANIGGLYNPTTRYFIAPASGYYQITFALAFGTSPSDLFLRKYIPPPTADINLQRSKMPVALEMTSGSHVEYLIAGEGLYLFLSGPANYRSTGGDRTASATCISLF